MLASSSPPNVSRVRHGPRSYKAATQGGAKLGDIYLSAIRQTVAARSLPLATRDLQIGRSTQESNPGLTGGAFMVIDELLSRDRIGRWIQQRTPVGRPDLVFSVVIGAS